MLSVAAVIELTRTVVYLIYGVRLKVKIDWIIINYNKLFILRVALAGSYCTKVHFYVL